MFDLIIKNGKIIDGGGNPPCHADVAIRDGMIAAVGKCLDERGARIIDAAGKIVCPGFIDSHSHSDLPLENMRDSHFKLEQGVTYEIVGMCGFSAAPLSDRQLDEGIALIRSLCAGGTPEDNAHKKTYSEYMDHMKGLSFGPSFSGFVGHNTIRAAVMGSADRDPTAEELEEMKAYVDDAMRAGALGISLGLYYTPGCYAKTEEAIELCKVVASYGGCMCLHMRYENQKLLEGVEEALKIGRETGVRVIISHHKASGTPDCWSLANESLPMIDRANDEGLDVFIDQYPYTSSLTTMKVRLPRKVLAMGSSAVLEALSDAAKRREIKEIMKKEMPDEERFFGVMIISSKSFPQYNGKMFLELAKELDRDPVDLCLEILLADELQTSNAGIKQSEDVVKMIMRHPRTMVGSDSLLYPGCEVTHPRAVGSFTRILGHYVREEKNLSLVEAVRKMTGLPSMVYNLKGKGLIRTGMDADIAIIDPERIIDRADFKNSLARGEGVDYVLVAGHVVVKDSEYLGGLYGKFIPRQ